VKKSAENSQKFSDQGLDAADIGARLREMRKKEPKQDQRQAAEIAGSSLRAWGDYENGKRMVPLEIASRFAQARGVDLFWIITGKDYSEHESPLEIDIPIYSNVSAGPLTFSFDDVGVIGQLRSDIKDLNVFALQVKGESMSPEIQNGDIILCNPNKPFVSGKLYVVVADDDSATVKRVYSRGGKFELLATNPEFETRIISEQELIRCDRVVEIRRKVH
jgi:repressor LexA